MKVVEALEKIKNKELTVLEIAKMYGAKSKKPIQTRIRELGYTWNSKAACYEYIGEDPEPVDISFEDLLSNVDQAKKEINRGQQETVSAIESKSLAKTIYDTSNIESNKEEDLIDKLLAGNSAAKPKRTYRGYYFDADVLSVIESVEKNHKSDLINEALRRVFKEKGYL